MHQALLYYLEANHYYVNVGFSTVYGHLINVIHISFITFKLSVHLMKVEAYGISISTRKICPYMCVWLG